MKKAWHCDGQIEWSQLLTLFLNYFLETISEGLNGLRSPLTMIDLFMIVEG